MHDPSLISRRSALLAAACALASASAAGRALGAGRHRRAPVPLPSAADIRRDYQQMVDFGPRLPGNANHLAFVDWMAGQFQDAGLMLGPCESYSYRRWDPRRVSLDVLDDGVRRPIAKVTFFVRSAPTGPEGVTGPLVYGGLLKPTGPDALPDFPKGSILVFDGQLPRLTMGSLTHPHFVHMGDEPKAASLDTPYHRLWTTPAFPLDDLAARGVVGVAIIMDVSSAMIEGNYSPHASHYRPKLPALFVGQDAGEELRRAAKAGRTAHLTLDAEWTTGDVPQLTAILPGESDEVMIVDTHTDGQNFVEENGCITLLHLARHFASLPQGERLRRSIVFAGWPGHMTGEMPEAPGWALAHPELMKRAAAAFTIEHLGSSEWLDIPGKGYAPTGHNEYMNCPTSAGPLTDIVVAGIKRQDLLRHGVEPGPGVTTGVVFHESGVPHMGLIGGPSYLLSIAPNGHIDKLDAGLAARQTAMLADVIRQADKVPMAALKGGDPSLGAKPVTGTDTSRRGACRSPRRTPTNRSQ
ncbi:hypothetical protein FHR20_001012 [Sphingomonas leidyi]|uniref:M28 family peptidase n=1 Tax=Sphingomonas leidyi TaxID=68569 RepID=A0A7X5UYL1_9SPHN|nr:hypothetical protein [Sphingomonas leidyi]NIJ64081.1 hypothetical protein [Sphingomonas leidyi]